MFSFGVNNSDVMKLCLNLMCDNILSTEEASIEDWAVPWHYYGSNISSTKDQRHTKQALSK